MDHGWDASSEAGELAFRIGVERATGFTPFGDAPGGKPA
jgi:hypothetical protein